jgi:hypothetical protein
MIPLQEKKSSPKHKDDEKDYDTLRRENSIVEDNSKHASKLRSTCHYYTNTYYD